MANGTPPIDHGITFTTKELILQLDAKVETLLTLVAAKAEQMEVNAIKIELAGIKGQLEHRSNQSHKQANELMILGGRLTALELKGSAVEAVDKYKKWFVSAVLFSIIGVVVGVLSLVQGG